MLRIPVAPGPPLLFPEFSVRSRREQPTRDLFNARRFEHWNEDVPTTEQNLPPTDKQAAYQDMKPINTRTVERDYRQAQPFVASGPQLGGNPYFQKYDVTTDPRNVARELRAAVYEYNPPRDQNVNQHMLSRNFESMFVPPAEVGASYEKAIDISAGMRPVLNNMKATFR